MSDAPEAAAMNAVAAAVTGPGTPNSAGVVSHPSRVALVALVLGGPVLCAMLAIIIWMLGPMPWPFAGAALWPTEAAEWRAKGLAGIGVSLCAILAVITFRLASGNLKKIEATAGPGSITVES